MNLWEIAALGVTLALGSIWLLSRVTTPCDKCSLAVWNRHRRHGYEVPPAWLLKYQGHWVWCWSTVDHVWNGDDGSIWFHLEGAPRDSVVCRGCARKHQLHVGYYRASSPSLKNVT